MYIPTKQTDGRPGRAFVGGYVASPGYVPGWNAINYHLKQGKTNRKCVIVPVCQSMTALRDYKKLGVSRNWKNVEGVYN